VTALTPQKSPGYRLKRTLKLVWAFWKRGISFVPAMESDQNLSVIQPKLRHYADCAVPVAIRMLNEKNCTHFY
jgi:hypothetical protein